MFWDKKGKEEQLPTQNNVVEEMMKEVESEEPKDEFTEELNQLSHDGYRLYKAGDYVTSREKFHKLLELDPTNQYGLVGLGDIARKENKIDIEIPVLYKISIVLKLLSTKNFFILVSSD